MKAHGANKKEQTKSDNRRGVSRGGRGGLLLVNTAGRALATLAARASPLFPRRESASVRFVFVSLLSL